MTGRVRERKESERGARKEKRKRESERKYIREEMKEMRHRRGQEKSERD